MFTNLVPIGVLLIFASIIYWAEKKPSLGGKQPTVAWVAGLIAGFLTLAAGTLAVAGWTGPVAGWLASLGTPAVVILGACGIVGALTLLWVALPQKVAKDVSSPMTLAIAFILPALVPYIGSLWTLFLAAVGPGATNVRHLTGG